jgi:hypothetical protein
MCAIVGGGVSILVNSAGFLAQDLKPPELRNGAPRFLRKVAALADLCLLAVCFGCNRAPAQPAKTVVSASRNQPTQPISQCQSSALPPDGPLQRLSVREYKNTLADLFEKSALHSVLEPVSMDLDELPRDGDAEARFSNMDQRTSQRHVDTYLKVADGIARAIVGSDERLTALAGNCAVEKELDRACFTRFVSDFGLRVKRRPLGESEQAPFMQLASAKDPARTVYQRAITELLASPDFLFHIERGRTEWQGHHGWYELTPFELASRLSYHFWQSMPDAELLRAAATGELATEAGYRKQVERLSNHHRARSTWFRFFREWLQLEDFGGFALDRAFNNFVGSIEATPELYRDAVWEVEQLVGYYTFDTPGSFRDLVLSDLIVTRSPRLAKLYQVEPWDGRSVPEHFPSKERSGLLTRAALLISANHATNPFRRGAFLKRRLLCDPIKPPAQLPPGALSLPVFEKNATTRERYKKKVDSASCRGCHDKFSPYGYALEAFDALGRYRQIERILDEAGEYQGKKPIDAKARVHIDPGEGVTVDGPVELSRAIASSPTAMSCFAQQYFRFTFRRMETPADQCTLDELSRSLSSGGLFGLYRNVAFTPAFRHRALAPEASTVALTPTSKPGATP